MIYFLPAVFITDLTIPAWESSFITCLGLSHLQLYILAFRFSLFPLMYICHIFLENEHIAIALPYFSSVFVFVSDTFMQGGKFDHADRLFQSIESSYRNSLSNTSDVKELIPEFFYMPEFLQNSNSYHLGVKQDGEPLGDVALPPWAKVIDKLFVFLYM